MSKLEEQAQAEFNAKRIEALTHKTITLDSIPNGFKNLLHSALMHTSLLNSRAGATIWHGMVLFDRDFKFPEVTLMIDIIKATTPKELGQTLEENLKMLVDFILPFEREMNEIDKEISINIQREISAKYKASKGVPIGHELFGKA